MSEEKLQEIGKVLSDETRVSILQFILASRHPVSVSDVAFKFGLHPNAARLHLAKLETARLLATQMRRNPEGGRPAKLYQLGPRRVEIQVPSRQFCLLATLFLKALKNGSENGSGSIEDEVEGVGEIYGRNLVRTEWGEGNISLVLDEAVDLWREQESELGSSPEVSRNRKGNYMIRFYNCIFEEVAVEDPVLVCKLHQGMLKGILKHVGDPVDLRQLQTKMNGADCCRLSLRQK